MENKNQYKKGLGFWHVVFLTIGAILGPAVAYVPVTVLADGGPAGILAWPIAFLLIIPIAFVYVEPGTMWPRAGGVAYYPARSHGSIVGTLNGWSAFVGYSLAMPAVVAAIVEYGSYFVPAFSTSSGTLSYMGILTAIVAVVIIFLINLRSINLLGDVNNGLTVLKVLIVLAVSIALLAYFKPSNVTGLGGFSPLGVSGIFLAISATIFAYAGFRQPIEYAEEVHTPEKFLPRAILVSLVFVMVFYMIESLAFLGTLNFHYLIDGVIKPASAPSTFAGKWALLSQLSYPFASNSLYIGLGIFAILAIVGVIIASFSDGIIYYGGAARVGNTLSRYDDYFPQIFSRIDSSGIPRYSVFLVLIISIVYLVLLPSFQSILSVFVDAVVFSYAPAAISLAVFRKKYPDVKRPFRLPAYQVLAPVAFVIGGLLIYWSGFQYVLISMLSVFVGLLLLGLYHRKRGISRDDFRGGIWLPAYMLVVLLLSYIGSSNFGGINIIIFPYDVLVFIVVTLVFYFIGYASGIRYQGKGVEDA